MRALAGLMYGLFATLMAGSLHAQGSEQGSVRWVAPAVKAEMRQLPRATLVDAVKYSGCTFDGLLNIGSSGIELDAKLTLSSRLALFDAYVDLLARSNCVFISRALELWNAPPDFPEVRRNIQALLERSRRTYMLGMNVAESVSLKSQYWYSDEDREFVFSDMCKTTPSKSATECIAAFSRQEYRKYVRHVIRRGIDIGIQVFLFGNVGLTDGDVTASDSALLELVSDMRSFAVLKNVSVLFIAQFPSSAGGRAYSEGFDLVQGAVYNDPDGTIPNNRVVINKNSTAVPDRLWLTPNYDAKKLVMEYDWFGSNLDDTSQVACLSIKSQQNIDAIRRYSKSVGSAEGCKFGLSSERSAVPVTKTIYEHFKNKGIGFWLPGRQPIAFPPWYYSPINMTLYKGQGSYEINFNDEEMLRIPPRR